jgi:integrase
MGVSSSARSINRLTDRSVRAFIAAARQGSAKKKKLSDGGGLFVTLTPAGTPVWRIKYRHGGKEKLFAAGTYPTVGLEAAREQREMVKAHLRAGRDPTQARRTERATAVAASPDTFEGLAQAWLEKRKAGWSDIHFRQSKRALERDVFPMLGKLPIGSITSPMVAAVVERIANRGAIETAGKVLWNVNRIFGLAKASGLCAENPALGVREVLPASKPHSQRPALLNFASLGEVLRKFESASVSPAVRLAHRLVAFTAARIGNAIAAEWSEFDLESDQTSWTIPRKKMKSKDRSHDHRVLLGPTIANELRTWRNIMGGSGFLFASPTGRKHITHESIEKALRVTCGYEDRHSVHGWRASFSTLAGDNGFSKEVVELALDHVVDSAIVRAYDIGARLAERKKLTLWWDTELSKAQQASKVIALLS